MISCSSQQLPSIHLGKQELASLHAGHISYGAIQLAGQSP
jgi:hypothetical protein